MSEQGKPTVHLDLDKPGEIAQFLIARSADAQRFAEALERSLEGESLSPEALEHLGQAVALILRAEATVMLGVSTLLLDVARRQQLVVPRLGDLRL